jgi:hypothetical protein
MEFTHAFYKNFPFQFNLSDLSDACKSILAFLRGKYTFFELGETAFIQL